MVVLIGRYGCAIWGMFVLFGGCGRVILRYAVLLTYYYGGRLVSNLFWGMVVLFGGYGSIILGYGCVILEGMVVLFGG